MGDRASMTSTSESHSWICNERLVAEGESVRAVSPTVLAGCEVCTWLVRFQRVRLGSAHDEDSTSGSHITPRDDDLKIDDPYFDTPAYNTSRLGDASSRCQEIAPRLRARSPGRELQQSEAAARAWTTPATRGRAHRRRSTGISTTATSSVTMLRPSRRDDGGGWRTPCSTARSAERPDVPSFTQASKANGDVYVDDLPNGGRRLTHVFWAPLDRSSTATKREGPANAGPSTCRIREGTLSLGDRPRSPSRRRACPRASPSASPASPRRLPRW